MTKESSLKVPGIRRQQKLLLTELMENKRLEEKRQGKDRNNHYFLCFSRKDDDEIFIRTALLNKTI